MKKQLRTIRRNHELPYITEELWIS